MHNLLDAGKKLLDKIPTKLQYVAAEKKILEKDASKKQLEFLWNDYNTRLKDVSVQYGRWFDTCLKELEIYDEPVLLNAFINTKTKVELKDKITAAILILEKFEDNTKKAAAKITPKKVASKSPWKKVIAKGESDLVEFKASIKWDYQEQKVNKKLYVAAIKTIAAFLNSSGGVLFVGVSDEGKVLGVEKDYPHLRKQNGDGLIQFLIQMVNSHLGKEFNKFIAMKLEKVERKEICIIDVTKSSKPVFMQLDNVEHFYIRASLSSQPLNVREAIEYVRMNWDEW